MLKRYVSLIIAVIMSLSTAVTTFATNIEHPPDSGINISTLEELPLGSSNLIPDIESPDIEIPTEDIGIDDEIMINEELENDEPKEPIKELPIGMSGLEFPDNLPMTIDKDCQVETSPDVYISNNSEYSIEITGLYINLNEGWEVLSMSDTFHDKTLDRKYFALMINDNELSKDAEISNISWILEPGESMNLVYNAIFSAQRTSSTTFIGNLEFKYNILDEDFEFSSSSEELEKDFEIEAIPEDIPLIEDLEDPIEHENTDESTPEDSQPTDEVIETLPDNTETVENDKTDSIVDEDELTENNDQIIILNPTEEPIDDDPSHIIVKKPKINLIDENKEELDI